MSVSEIKVISIIGLMQDLGEVAKICGKSGIFQPDDVFSFYSNTEKFTPVAEENPYSMLLKRLTDTVKNSGKSLEIVNISDFDADESQVKEYVEYISDKLGELIGRKKDLADEFKEHKEEISRIEKFRSLDLKIKDLTQCEYAKVRFGKLPRESYDKLSLSSEGKDILFFPCTSDNSYYWGIYFAPANELDEVDRIFSGLYFENIDVKPFDGTVSERIEVLKEKCRQINDEVYKTDKKIESFWKQQVGQCMRVYSKLKEHEAFYGIKKFAARYNESFILVGWIPAENEREFCSRLSEINGVEYSTETGKNILSHSPPVRLKNKKLFRPFEFFVDTYGVPSYDEIDPTIFVSITYAVLFGIMFADLGQGLVVSIVGYLMWKLKGMKLGKPLISCGIFSALFGTLFGSVFGYEDALDPFYKNVFGLKGKPIEVMNSRTTNVIIYLAVGIGIVLLLFAMMLNIYSSVRRHKYGEALFGPNGISGLIFYSASVLLLLDSVMFHLGVGNIFYIIVFIAAPLVLIMFNEILSKTVDGKSDWQPESWGDYIAQSIFEMFEVVLSYVTNTMSFLRVGAFVLVHAGMMMVVFTIAEMLGGFGYVLAVIIGNIFVIALEALLAGIQVLRLEFYELFSRFFEGQGRPFTPVVVKEQI